MNNKLNTSKGTNDKATKASDEKTENNLTLHSLPLNGKTENEKSDSDYYFIDIDKATKKNPYGWYYDGEKHPRHLGEFDVQIHTKTFRFNPETQLYSDIVLELQLLYPSNLTSGQIKTRPSIELTYKEAVSASDIRTTILSLTNKSHGFKNDRDVSDFYEELMRQCPPKEVYQIDHYGFIDHNGHQFYLTKNILITIPKDHETGPQYMIAPDTTGAFPYIPSGDDYTFKPGRLEPAPRLFPLPPVENGIYSTENYLYDNNELKYFINEVRDKMGELVSGQKEETKPEGYMIFAWMMSFLFFDEIYQEFQHVVYIYIWGEPSTGKGKLSQILLNFFGQSFTDVDSNPTLKSAENKLANHSKIPVIMDEFHPEKSKISAQIFNMWFELRQRGVSASHDRSKNAWSPVRSQVLFISNYKPTEDHFRSRCLMIEYAREKRGREKLVFWFHDHEHDMQRLFVTLLYRFNRFNRVLFRKELHITKQMLSQALAQELEKRKEREGIVFQVKDRQIENMAALIVTDIFISHPATISTIESLEFEKKNGSDPSVLADMQEHATRVRTESNMFRFAIQFLANSAEREIQQTALQQFLATLEVMSEKGELNEKYFNDKKSMMEKNGGDIIFYWSGVWDEYTKYQQGREIVSERALRDEIEAVATNGKPTTHSYSWRTSMDSGSSNRHGYRIQKSNCTPSWYRAFGHRGLAEELLLVKNNSIPE